MSNRETRARETLAAAQAHYDAVTAKWHNRPKPARGVADREITAAYNALQNALWPFYTGKYPMPTDTGYGLNG